MVLCARSAHAFTSGWLTSPHFRLPLCSRRERIRTLTRKRIRRQSRSGSGPGSGPGLAAAAHRRPRLEYVAGRHTCLVSSVRGDRAFVRACVTRALFSTYIDIVPRNERRSMRL